MNSHNNIIEKIKSLGFYPDLIIDIGSYKCEWTTSTLCYYPNSYYILFEPNEYPEHNHLNEQSNIKVVNKILASNIQNVNWYSNKTTGDSLFQEKSEYYKYIEPKKEITTYLDLEIEQVNIDYSDALIKIDTQGSELEILKGGQDTLSKTSFVISEVPVFGEYNSGAPTFKDYIIFLENYQFVPFEIIDFHYRGHENFQIQSDIIFIKKNHPIHKIALSKTFI